MTWSEHLLRVVSAVDGIGTGVKVLDYEWVLGGWRCSPRQAYLWVRVVNIQESLGGGWSGTTAAANEGVDA